MNRPPGQWRTRVIRSRLPSEQAASSVSRLPSALLCFRCVTSSAHRPERCWGLARIAGYQ